MMHQNNGGEIIQYKREKFRVQIRNQMLQSEFKKKRVHISINTQQNEFLIRLLQELEQFKDLDMTNLEQLGHFQLLLQALLKTLDDDQGLDSNVTKVLVKKIKQLVEISRINVEFLELANELIQQILFLLQESDYDKLDELDDLELQQFLFENAQSGIFNRAPQSICSLQLLVKNKQNYRDLIVANNCEIIENIVNKDQFSQCTHEILGLILAAVNYDNCEVDFTKRNKIIEFIEFQYLDNNLSIKRLVLEIFSDILNHLPKELDSQFADKFIQSQTFKKIYDDAFKISYDALPKLLILHYFGLSSFLNSFQLDFYNKILTNQQYRSFELQQQLNIKLYWSLSNKIIDKEYIDLIEESNILKQIFQIGLTATIREQLEISYIIRNLCCYGNLEQLSKAIKHGMITLCENMLISQPENNNTEQINNIVLSLTNLLKIFQNNKDYSNELIIPFSNVKAQIENTKIVEIITSSQCDLKLINDFDVFF